VTDKHPDRYFEQSFLLLDANKLVFVVAPLVSSSRHIGASLCDLHSRWNPSGRYLASIQLTKVGGRFT
jgi:hypothetical protein